MKCVVCNKEGGNDGEGVITLQSTPSGSVCPNCINHLVEDVMRMRTPWTKKDLKDWGYGESNYLQKEIGIVRRMRRRARSIAHVEYEVINFIGKRLYLDDLIKQMVPEEDEVAKKRFDKGATNISTYLKNMANRRLHKLPKDHPDYKEREE